MFSFTNQVKVTVEIKIETNKKAGAVDMQTVGTGTIILPTEN